MKPGIKMLMMANRGDNDSRPAGRRHEERGDVRREMNYPYSGYRGDAEYETTRNEYNGSDMNYGGVEGRFRDRRGREHYDDGRYAPMRGNMPPARDVEMNWPMPIYEREPDMNQIGFVPEREYGQMNYHQYGQKQNAMQREGHMMGHSGKTPMTKDIAMMWVQGMENEDGSRGPHWTLEQAKQVMAQRNIECDPLDFFLALNIMYSDYSKVFKKHGVGEKMDFYADMAKAFLDDKDAEPNKLARYYEAVVKK